MKNKDRYYLDEVEFKEAGNNLVIVYEGKTVLTGHSDLYGTVLSFMNWLEMDSRIKVTEYERYYLNGIYSMCNLKENETIWITKNSHAKRVEVWRKGKVVAIAPDDLEFENLQNDVMYKINDFQLMKGD